MITLISMFITYKIYKKDCLEYGSENLAVSLSERLLACFACGFWVSDLVMWRIIFMLKI